MSCVGNAHVLRVRAHLQKFLDALFSEHIREFPADQKSGQGQLSGAGFETLLASLEVPMLGAEAGIPMPAEFTVRRETNILRQPSEILHRLALWLVGADGFGHFLQRCESLRFLVHE